MKSVQQATNAEGSLAPGDDDDRSYEKVQFSDKEEEEVRESGAHAAVISSTKEVIEVQWGKVLWVTTRDQLLSPLIQGALWYVHLRPFLVVLPKEFNLASICCIFWSDYHHTRTTD